MEFLLRLLNIRSEDRRKLVLMAPVFFLCGIAELMTYNGFMTLFNQRFGSEFLPYVYAAEAVILPLEAWFMSWLTGRLSKPALMRTLYGIMVGLVVLNAVVLAALLAADADVRWYYPFLFLTSSFVVRQQTILLWSLAVDLCPTQQAKRLMPMFVSAATLGGIVSGLLVQAVNKLLGADFVYILAPLFLLAGMINYRKAIVRYLVPLTLRDDKRAAEAPQVLRSSDYFKQSLRSPFLLCAIGLMTLMPALYFLMEYQFLTISHRYFATEEQFGAFFGLITTLLFTAAFLLQMISGRLMARLGASNVLVAIAGVFVLCFLGLALAFDTSLLLYAVSGGYMFVYLLLYYFAEPSYQLFFKIMPIESRDGFRYVAQGIAASAGIALGAGLQFLHTGFGLPLQPLAIVGTLAAVALIGLAWTERQLYVRELIRGVQHMRSAGMELAASFEGFFHHAKTLAAVRGLLRHPNDYAREVALDIIRRTQDERFLPQLLDLVDDRSARIRIAALRAMRLDLADLPAMVKVASYLEDPDYEVRAEGVRLLARAVHMKHQAFYFIRLKLLDPHPMVVAEAVKGLYALESEQSYEACYEVIQRLLGEGGEGAVYMIEAIAELDMYSFLPDVEPLLQAEQPSVKTAAIRCLGKLGHHAAIGGMLTLLPTSDPEVHASVTEAFGQMGEQAVEPLRQALFYAHPKVWNTAMTALARLLDEQGCQAHLVPECVQRLDQLHGERGMAAALAYRDWADLAELTELRLGEIRALVLGGVWAVMSRLSDEQVIAALRQAIEDADEETRENGLEILSEGTGDRRLSAALLATLQKLEQPIRVASEAEATERIQQGGQSTDHWLCALAFSAYQRMENKTMQDELQLFGMLDKVVFLKQVSFFSDLSIEELGLIAGIAEEETHADQAELLRKGEVSPAMYVIISGNVELSSRSTSGVEGTIGVLGPREVFGETSALDSSPSNVTAVALLGEVRMLALNGEEVSRLIRLHPEIGIGLLRASFARVRQLEQMIMRIGE
ncbi:cyclic nucleotide-binding domain-containing protein [Paenibacillus sp. IB182496]|uniref:Cyclic nucleotide-binding domain-containing protein n=1 Tax=Paenibacillus sabuli TaxID=2772509 RepID=A0A927GTR4_9BACL|nr:MFS transporter [Paenibacillus sabuli]MBD2847893.1 cyclic nucleotide-binding domain-containing protein [Paenibacillus sabuli]